MPKIIDNKVYRDGQKIGWLEGRKVKSEDNQILGFYDDQNVYNPSDHKIAYTKDGNLHFENGNPHVSLDRINEEVEGTYPLPVKCAVYVLFEE